MPSRTIQTTQWPLECSCNVLQVLQVWQLHECEFVQMGTLHPKLGVFPLVFLFLAKTESRPTWNTLGPWLDAGPRSWLAKAWCPACPPGAGGGGATGAAGPMFLEGR